MKYWYKDMPKEDVRKVFELLDRIERGGGEEIAWVDSLRSCYARCVRIAHRGE